MHETVSYKDDNILSTLCNVLELLDALSKDFVLQLMKIIILVDRQCIGLICDENKIPQHFATQHRSIPVVDFLLDENLKSAAVIDENGDNFLSYAVLNR